MKLSKVEHLSKEDIVKNGSIFTPQFLVSLVKNMTLGFIDSQSVIMDFGTGYGAFLEQFAEEGKRCIATDLDKLSTDLIAHTFPNVEVINENSLLSVSREKYGLNDNDSLIIIGNPPYNDITSQYHKNNKGENKCDSDLLSRDLGISFLKMYNKLKASYVCVLHPLSYLIKKQNFNSLGDFKNNYILQRATIFSSSNFESIKKTNISFPVVAALYKKDNNGMSFEFVQNFGFDIFNSDKKFYMSDTMTIDGIVRKYPKKDCHTGLQFYTLRDMNALKRNTTFLEGNVANGVEVKIDDLFQYAWLDYLKKHYVENNWSCIYGNLSPLYSNKIEKDDYKQALIAYILEENVLIRKYFSLEELTEEYGPLCRNDKLINDLIEELFNKF